MLPATVLYSRHRRVSAALHMIQTEPLSPGYRLQLQASIGTELVTIRELGVLYELRTQF